MHSTDPVTIAVAVNDADVLRRNLLASPQLADGACLGPVLIKKGFRCASHAYNVAIAEAQTDVVIFVHQDVYLPAGWFEQLRRSMAALHGTGWGVLGCFGGRSSAREGVGHVLTNGVGIHGEPLSRPEPVDTLDEIVLVIRRSSGLRFDPSLPHFHLYGTDICLSARERGMPCFAIPAFCVHNTNQILQLPAEYWECYEYVKTKWKRFLPIHTSCVTISRFDRERHYRRIRELGHRLLGRRRTPKRRVSDPKTLLAAWRPPADMYER
jgi:hypothetical protein